MLDLGSTYTGCNGISINQYRVVVYPIVCIAIEDIGFCKHSLPTCRQVPRARLLQFLPFILHFTSLPVSHQNVRGAASAGIDGTTASYDGQRHSMIGASSNRPLIRASTSPPLNISAAVCLQTLLRAPQTSESHLVGCCKSSRSDDVTPWLTRLPAGWHS